MILKRFNYNLPKVVLIQGSPRDPDTCPGMESKTHTIIQYVIDKWSLDFDFEIIDLSVNQNKQSTIQPCKGCVSTAGGYHCHYKCIAPDQRVHMLDGFKEIKDIKIGDILQDGNKVLNHMITSPNEKIYELKLEDGRCLKLTSNHKVKVLSKERYRDKESGFKYYRKEEWLELKNIKVGDNIPFIDTDSSIIELIKEDDDLYLIYGLICGDGTLANNTSILYIDSKEVEFLDQIKNKLNNKIISILEHKIKNSIIRNTQKNEVKMLKITFGSDIGKKFKKLFTKDKATERRLNLKSFKNKKQIFNFLNGWISTDGSINREDGYIIIYNTSFHLLRDLQLLLSRIGIRSNINDIRHIETEISGKKYQGCSSLIISDQDSVEIIKNNINLINPKKGEILSKYKQRRKLKRSFSKVKSITDIGYSEVYDITVEKSHEFICEGIKVHNCSCYKKNDPTKPDFMYDDDVYDKIERANAFLVFSPIHWYSLTSQVKLMFDRLVCINQTLTKEEALKLMGEDFKNPAVTGKLSQSGKLNGKLKNHWAGKYAGFYVHGDDGANDYQNKNYPESYQIMFDPYTDPKNAVNPFILQMKYSGVFVPDELVEAFYVNKGLDYYSANIGINPVFFDKADNLLKNLKNILG